MSYSYDNMNPQGGQGMNNAMNMNDMNLLAELNGWGSGGMSNGGGMQGQFGGQQSGNNMVNQQGHNSYAPSNSSMQMNGPGNTDGYSQGSPTRTMQVRTGGGVPSFPTNGRQQIRTGEALSSFQDNNMGMGRQQIRTGAPMPSFPGSMSMVRQQVRTGEAPPSFTSNNMGMGRQQQQQVRTGMPMPSFPGRPGNIERSSSEPTLNNMMGMFDHQPDPSNNNMGNNMPTNAQPSGRGGGFGGFDDLNAMGFGNGNNMMDNNMNSGGGEQHARRHSEPTLSLLADIFDESTKVGGEESNDIDDSGRSGGSNPRSSGDGWSSPVHPPASFDKPITGDPSLRPRANSAPQISEMMFELQNLEPEHVFDRQQDMPKRDHNFDMRTGATGGQVKRSRSVDPIEMFRRSEDGGGFMGPQGSQAMPRRGSGGFDDMHQGLVSHEDRKPKRRRSAPLLHQGIEGSLFDESSNTGTGGNPASSLGSGPMAVLQNLTAQQTGGAAQGGQKNNVNLIQMLLGIETGMGNATGPNEVAGGASGGTMCQEIPNPANQFRRSNSAPLSSQHLSLSDVPGSSNVHQQGPKPQQFPPNSGAWDGVPMPQQHHSSNVSLGSAPMLQQQPNPALQQQPVPTNISFGSNPQGVTDQMLLNAQLAGGAFAPPNQNSNTHQQQQEPPPLNINNSEDLNLVLSAVKETQTNLQTLQPLVMQLGDPEAMEEIAKAFKITASSSQFVLASDLPSAYSALNDAWAKIKNLEERLAQGAQQPQIPGMPANLLAQMMLAQQAGAMGVNHPALKLNKSYAPIAQAKKREEEVVPPKPKSKPRPKVKRPSPPPSPIQDVIALEDLPTQNEADPDVIMERLKGLMERTQMSQKQLQRWDRKNGLPKSHSQTMVNSNRSRKQLQKGVILHKWNGDPLIQEKDMLKKDEDGSDAAKEKSDEEEDELTEKTRAETEELWQEQSEKKQGGVGWVDIESSDPALMAKMDGRRLSSEKKSHDQAGDDLSMGQEDTFNDNVLDVLNMCT